MKRWFLFVIVVICHTTFFSAQDKVSNSGDTVGLINLSVANIRAKPSYTSEMVTQALLGTPVTILEKQRGWLRVRMPDGYAGWTNSSVQPLNREKLTGWNSLPQIIFTQPYGFAYSKPDFKSQTISDLVIGSILKYEGTQKGFYRVSYPDGRVAYVSSKESMPLDQWKRSRSLTGENIVRTARTFMGIPYLWGGTSSKGMDCSGFTKMVYFLNGVILQRDASEQIQGGTDVDTSGGFDHLQPGDLLFFGEKAQGDKPERIIHVAISLGKTEFIHASGMIRTASLDPGSSDYDEYNLKRFIRAKRMIGSVDEINSWMFL